MSTQGQESAWLIEMSDGGSPTYWCRLDDEDGVCGWSKDHSKAIRFCRAQDAQAIIDDFGWEECARVAETFHEDDDGIDRQVKRHVAAALRALAQQDTGGDDGQE